MRQKKREVRITNATAAAVPTAVVRDAVVTVLDGEQTGAADVSVTFLSGQRMRALNRRTFGVDRATDVIAFALPHPGRIVGDVYVCPSVARRAAERLGVPVRQELLRLVVHGTLHVLGYDHPTGQERTVSLMWRVQERYVGGMKRGQR
ncbi:MAG: rRNA maturation RNase YbeY [Gemmatimonadota bacterium]|nr:MAG: rRNA maturation RNase YbeY [Gemmatimonadota bacterium]